MGSATNRGQGVYDPPLLWPVGASKFAYSTGQGPVAHLLRLRSAYSQQADAWGTGEPAFTSYHHMFKVRLCMVLRLEVVYGIFYTSDRSRSRPLRS